MNGLLLPFAAVAAGVVSASSPCVLPVLPGYIAAVSATDTDDGGQRPRARIIGALGFVAGFTIVFGVAASSRHRCAVARSTQRSELRQRP